MYKGELIGFPEEIVERMLDYQVEQGNPRDVSIFEDSVSYGISSGGFDWDQTPEDHNFWNNVIHHKDFNLFFKKYPKQSKYPKVMWVWHTNIMDKRKRVVFMEKCGKFLAWNKAETIKEAEYESVCVTWENAEDIIEEPKQKEINKSKIISQIQELLEKLK